MNDAEKEDQKNQKRTGTQGETKDRNEDVRQRDTATPRVGNPAKGGEEDKERK